MGIPQNIVDAYNASLVRTTPTGLSQARGYLSATSIGDYALFGGGATSGIFDNVSTVDAYNTSLVRSTPTGLSQARSLLSATSVGNYALFGGGTYNQNTGYADTVDAYVVS